MWRQKNRIPKPVPSHKSVACSPPLIPRYHKYHSQRTWWSCTLPFCSPCLFPPYCTRGTQLIAPTLERNFLSTCSNFRRILPIPSLLLFLPLSPNWDLSGENFWIICKLVPEDETLLHHYYRTSLVHNDVHYHIPPVVIFSNGKKTKKSKMDEASEQRQVLEKMTYIKRQEEEERWEIISEII